MRGPRTSFPPKASGTPRFLRGSFLLGVAPPGPGFYQKATQQEIKSAVAGETACDESGTCEEVKVTGAGDRRDEGTWTRWGP